VLCVIHFSCPPIYLPPSPIRTSCRACTRVRLFYIAASPTQVSERLADAGGFKLWECAVDLIHLLQQQLPKLPGSTVLVDATAPHATVSVRRQRNMQRRGLSTRLDGPCAALAHSWATSYRAAHWRCPSNKVLELGCGHGLPGIFCASHGAASVHFQVRAARLACAFWCLARCVLWPASCTCASSPLAALKPCRCGRCRRLHWLV
jgi:hypothetical protein